MDTVSYAIFAGLIGCLVLIISVSWWYIRRLVKENRQHQQYTQEQKNLQREMQLKAKQKFEKVVAENASFIEQDVRTTAETLSGRMEKELTHTLTDELAHYKTVSEQAAVKMQDILKTIQDTAQVEQKKLLAQIQMQQEKMSQELASQHEQIAERIEALVKGEVTRRIGRFEETMASVIQSYVVAAVRDQLDVDSEFEYIMRELEANKELLREDISNGAV